MSRESEMEFRIRPADSYDVEEMAKLLACNTGTPAGKVADRKRLVKGLTMMIGSSEERLALIAEKKDAIVGLVTAQIMVSASEGGLVAVAGELTVAKSCKCNPVDVRLLSAVEGWARSLGALHTYLVCGKLPSEEATRYEEAGWKKTDCEYRLLGGSASGAAFVKA